MEDTTEEKEQMYHKVLNYVAESLKSESDDFVGTVSTSFLETLTGIPLTEEIAISSNDELTDTYKHIVVAYGFEDFHSLYLFAMSTESLETVSKAGQKDFSKLKKVKRNVVRNGKSTTMTFYENSEGDSDAGGSSSGEDGEEEDPRTQVRPAAELPANIIGDIDSKVPIKDLKLLNKQFKKMEASEDQEFNADCDQYLVLTDEEGNPRGISGFTRKGDYIYLDFSSGDMYTTGVSVRAFYQLVRLARQLDLGAAMPIEDNRLQHTLAENSGFEDDGEGYFRAEAKDLEQLFGEV